MSDRSRHDLDVDEALAEWQAQTNDLAALRRELAEEREVIGIIARERNQLRGELEATRIRLARALEGERVAQRANRPIDLRGALVALWDVITGRTA